MSKRTRECSFPGCERKHKYWDLCDGHAQQKKTGKTLRPLRPNTRNMPPEDRFWLKVKKTDGCWEWQGALSQNGKGYGVLTVDKKNVAAHRFSWELVHGAIPNGQEIDHKCFNKKCVNPSHLRLANRAENCQHRSGAQSNNKSSGVRGVYYNKRSGRWFAKVMHKRKSYYLGEYDSVEEAAHVAKEKRKEMFKHSEPTEP